MTTFYVGLPDHSGLTPMYTNTSESRKDMMDQKKNVEHIEDSLGPEWPKKVYPHGAGREWSTEQYDRWKADLGVELVPFDRKALEALRDYVMGDSTEDIQHGLDWLNKILVDEVDDEDLA